MKMPLHLKLALINVIGLLIVVLVVDLAIRRIAAEYFATLVEKFGIAPRDAHDMFLAAVERYLFAAYIVGCLTSIALGYWLTRRSLEPLTLVMEGARQIAAGDYTVRICETNCGEVSDLAKVFNRMVESLVVTEQMRKDMVTNVAHELRTPLTNIRGYLEALTDRVIAPSSEVFGSLHDETLRLVSLADNLLQLARANAERNPLRIETVRLDEVILQTLQLFELKFSGKGLKVEKDLAAAETRIRADSGKLTQVLTNLLENAWRYSPRSGRVVVSARKLPMAIEVVVRNSSDAPVQENNSRIFERFHREELSQTLVPGGAGIGLAIVKEIVEGHGRSVGNCMANGDICIWFTWPA
jgi:two-component system, OmpR family, sensor histidine kinase BaeS